MKRDIITLCIVLSICNRVIESRSKGYFNIIDNTKSKTEQAPLI